MLQYMFHGFNCRAETKWRDTLLDIGTEEIGHVEMLCTMIARLLKKALVAEQEEAAEQQPVIWLAEPMVQVRSIAPAKVLFLDL